VNERDLGGGKLRGPEFAN